MSFYLIVFQGGNAVGSAAMGITAERVGLSPTMLAAAAALALGPLAGLRYRFQSIPPEELVPAGDWPQPLLAADEPPGGPVMVTVEYRPREGREGDLLAALEAARFGRRRTGATSWRVWQDAADPNRIVEQFVVASWSEHLRQHERFTTRDQDRLNRIRSLSDPDRAPTVTHWLTPQPAHEPVPTAGQPAPTPDPAPDDNLRPT
jgi:hypothetical protein